MVRLGPDGARIKFARIKFARIKIAQTPAQGTPSWNYCIFIVEVKRASWGFSVVACRYPFIVYVYSIAIPRCIGIPINENQGYPRVGWVLSLAYIIG